VDDADALDGLRPDERERLARFATLFERLDGSMYATLAVREGAESAALEEAKAAALKLIPTGRRREAVRAAVRAFVDAATVTYSRRMSLPDTLLLFQSLPDRAEDRVRFLASVERAVVGLTLWDELDEIDRDVLLGPWGTILGLAG
jgi:hypothetical protein